MATDTAPAVSRSAVHPRVGRAERSVVIALTIAFAAVLAVWAVVTTTYKAPDEPTHVDAVLHLAIGNEWAAPGEMHYLAATQASLDANLAEPASRHQTWGALLEQFPGLTATSIDQMSQHPPTYYAIAAGVLHLVHFEDLRWDLGVLVLRLFDALLVLPMPFLAWATVRRLTGSPRAALVGGAAIIGIPEVAAIGASVTNDALMLPLAGTLVYLVVRLLTGDRRVRTTIWIGLLLGAMLLVKGTALPAVPFVGIAVLAAGLTRATALRNALRALWTLAIAAVVGGWWWLRNLIVYHDIQPDGLAKYARPPKPFPADTAANPEVFLRDYWNGVSRTFWGSVGGLTQFQIAQVLIDGLTVVCLLGIIVWAFRRGPSLRPAIVLASFPVILIALHMQSGWSGYMKNTIVAGTQGRYYYPTLLVLIALSALAWRRVTVTAAGTTRLAVGMSVAATAMGLYGVVYALRAFGQDAAFWIDDAVVQQFDQTGALAAGGAFTLASVAAVALVGTAVLLVRFMRRPEFTAARPTVDESQPPAAAPRPGVEA
ncbi:glycosyltransferase family 39 protein [Curtobacterium sp. YC1]|uniref:glycosyltransferase family 39 protein n=1 Tax=Curtobacterium sp. YC1 TaxID=2795488 RepID=UPI0018E5618E|nr:glycosyltransferase family 39 protein [Curtobacterium sp. YC1]QQD75233.1 glycosyltransferase family 39 protein [Curtobacterium sp. YC1]